MTGQNIFDDDIFFEGYRAIRGRASNANDLVEKPAFFSLVPPLDGKTVLDLGCGYGENCVTFARMSARRVLGIDVSQKMLNIARQEHTAPGIEYHNLCMEDLVRLSGLFDVVASSLAIHYVEDFDALVKDVFRLLSPGGVFLFSQENPINTCFTGGPRWTYAEDGTALYTNLSNYSTDGARPYHWFVDNVVKYHRTFSSIINSLAAAGFLIDRLLEPIPGPDIMEQYPAYQKDLHKPDFLLVRVHKP